MKSRRALRLLPVVTTLALALTACDAGVPSSMHHMGVRPRHGSSWSGWAGGMGGMMGRAPGGYHFRTPSCAPPAGLPGTVVTVLVGDMGMMHLAGGVAPFGSHMMLHAAPDSARAGQVSLVVANVGWRTHELVVLPLAPGHSSGERAVGADRRVSEAGSLGEASATCAAGEGDGIRSGSGGWVTLTLPAGQYELVCNLPNHYSSGMHQAFTVR